MNVLSVSAVLTAIFTGISAFIMYKEKIRRQTPEVKTRLDRPTADQPNYVLSLFFTPGDADYAIHDIKIDGCDVSEEFTFAQLGVPPAIKNRPIWRKSVLINKMIYSELNSRTTNMRGTAGTLRPSISFCIRMKKPMRLLIVHIRPLLWDRILFRQQAIRKQIFVEGFN